MMYKSYTRQALPERKYSELLGLCVTGFNSNNSFIIENVLNRNVLNRNVLNSDSNNNSESSP